MRRLGKWLAITFATLVALVLIAAAAFFAIFDVDLGHGVGDRDVAVTTSENLHEPLPARDRHRSTSISDELELPVGETHVDASVDVGDLP